MDLRIEAVELGRVEQRVDGGEAFFSRIGSGKEIVIKLHTYEEYALANLTIIVPSLKNDYRSRSRTIPGCLNYRSFLPIDNVLWEIQIGINPSVPPC
jgi:hypothetical protein